MAKRGGRRKDLEQPEAESPPPAEDDEHEVDLNDYEVVAHAENREEADFYRRLLAEHEIDVLFSDDLDDYEPEEGEEGIAILVPDEEIDTAYHLIKDHEEYIATGGILGTDDDDESEDDSDSELTGHAHAGYEDYEPLDHGDEDDELGDEDHEDAAEPPLFFDDEEH